jgi:hypothetical protein
VERTRVIPNNGRVELVVMATEYRIQLFHTGISTYRAVELWPLPTTILENIVLANVGARKLITSRFSRARHRSLTTVTIAESGDSVVD